MTQTTKKIGLICVKYMPTVLAVTCSLKILLLVMSHTEKDIYLYAVNWINVVLSLIVLGAVYVLGKAFGYCWKHRSLCRVALWGYIYYSFFLLVHVPKDQVISISTLYLISVIIFTVLYKEVK